MSRRRRRAWIGKLNARTPRINEHAHTLLKTIFATAVQDELLDRNPCRERMRKPVRHIGEPATLDELALLVAAMPERLRLMIELADSVRVVAFPPHIGEAIKDHLRMHAQWGKDGLLSPTTHGEQYRAPTFHQASSEGQGGCWAARPAFPRPPAHRSHLGGCVRRHPGRTHAALGPLDRLGGTGLPARRPRLRTSGSPRTRICGHWHNLTSPGATGQRREALYLAGSGPVGEDLKRRGLRYVGHSCWFSWRSRCAEGARFPPCSLGLAGRQVVVMASAAASASARASAASTSAYSAAATA